jgi:hypothetical protein
MNVEVVPDVPVLFMSYQCSGYEAEIKYALKTVFLKKICSVGSFSSETGECWRKEHYLE